MDKENVEIVTEDYFENVPEDVVNYLTETGSKYLERQEASYWNIRERCQKLTNLLVAGVSALVLYLFSHPNQLWLFLTVITLWGSCAGVLICLCLMAKGRYTGATTPLAMYVEGKSVLYLKRKRLYSLTYSAERLEEMNKTMAAWFNRAVIVSFFTPIIGSIIYFFFGW